MLVAIITALLAAGVPAAASSPVWAVSAASAADTRTWQVFASQGNQPGQFTGPDGIAVDPQGNVYVLDSIAEHVQKFFFPGRPAPRAAGRTLPSRP